MRHDPRFYDPKQMAQIAAFYKGLEELVKGLEPEFTATLDNPLFIYSLEIIIQHRDDYTVGRFGMEDFLFFELTDEGYGKSQSDGQASRQPDGVDPAIPKEAAA
jgi:hypothetical protein